jgi:hypothetical protein
MVTWQNRDRIRSNRIAAATVEVVMATAASIVMIGPLFILGVRAIRNLSHVMLTLVGWPYL